jgi:mRNA interferase RelE/StbE
VTGPRRHTVVLSAAAKRAIERDLPEPVAVAVAVAVVNFLYGPLAADPYRVGKPLRFELEGYWSARRGQYRVIYSIHDDEVLVRVVRISHRADVYG